MRREIAFPSQKSTTRKPKFVDRTNTIYDTNERKKLPIFHVQHVNGSIIKYDTRTFFIRLAKVGTVAQNGRKMILMAWEHDSKASLSIQPIIEVYLASIFSSIHSLRPDYWHRNSPNCSKFSHWAKSLEKLVNHQACSLVGQTIAVDLLGKPDGEGARGDLKTPPRATCHIKDTQFHRSHIQTRI